MKSYVLNKNKTIKVLKRVSNEKIRSIQKGHWGKYTVSIKFGHHILTKIECWINDFL